MVKDYAFLALDGCLPDDYPVREGVIMKVKTTFYNRRSGVDYDPVIHTEYPRSRADQLSYQPTSKLIDQMIRTGQLVMASKSQYDFPDGKDDGRDVPFDRLRGLDYPEVSQALAENESKLKSHEKAIKAMATKKETDAQNGVDESGPDDKRSKTERGGSDGSEA